MVIVRLTGGLGNQLFQYAAGLRIALVCNAELRLDVVSFLRDRKRQYSLAPFGLSGVVASNREVRLFEGRERVRSAKHALYRRMPQRWRSWNWIRQQSLRFEPDILQSRGNVFLDGSWQSEGYFKDVASRVHNEFTVREPLAGRNLSLAEMIKSTPCAVSMHVRRGDYVADPATRSIHEVCSTEYYNKALQALTGSVSRPHIFVFSDDPAWAHENIRLPFATTVVDHNPPTQPHQDLRLMSLCTHHIIANSSFSWWGAWLSRQPGKMVFAPSRWFNCGGYEINEIIPDGWNLVDFTTALSGA